MPAMEKTTSLSDDIEPIHGWFGLSYSNYLVLQRSILQSTPLEWQLRFVACLEELQEMAWGVEGQPDTFHVTPRGAGGRFYKDPLANYDRGRRIVPLNIVQKDAA